MSDEGMSDAEFDAKVGFPVGERYVPKSKLDAAEARALAAEANERARWADWARVRSALNHRWAAEGEHLRTERIALSSAYAELADAIERNEHGAGK